MMAGNMHSYAMKMDVANACAMSTYVTGAFERRCNVDVLTTPDPGLRRQTISIKTQQRR
jgi:hypothetical protein